MNGMGWDGMGCETLLDFCSFTRWLLLSALGNWLINDENIVRSSNFGRRCSDVNLNVM